MNSATPALLALLTLTLGAAAARAATPATAPTRADYAARYGSISDHNIFLRERGKPTPASRGGRSAYGSRDARRNPIDTTFVLTGIVLKEDGVYCAYVEDGLRSKLLRVVVGQPVARGRLDAIEVDAVLYTVEGQQIWVEIGQNFNGGPRSATTEPSTNPSTNPSPDEDDPPAATTAPTTLPLDPNDPNLTVEQKMKLKRLMGK